MSAAIVLVLAAACLAQETRPTWVGRIRVGDSVSGVLEGAPAARACELAVETDGKVTISLESFDFDALLRVEGEAGEKVAEDDNGGVETNARLVLQAKMGARYRI
ncbi:MAG TPA: hypothetical protein VKF62_12880, partial [Planctomycetota bacterium]|nr:hypothetical protein [Planctomycetota bacterium]